MCTKEFILQENKDSKAVLSFSAAVILANNVFIGLTDYSTTSSPADAVRETCPQTTGGVPCCRCRERSRSRLPIQPSQPIQYILKCDTHLATYVGGGVRKHNRHGCDALNGGDVVAMKGIRRQCAEFNVIRDLPTAATIAAFRTLTPNVWCASEHE